MDPGSLSCPGCSSKLRLAPGLKAGDPVRCPRCDRTFAVPAHALPPPFEPAIPTPSVLRVVEEMDRRLGHDDPPRDPAPRYPGPREVPEPVYSPSLGLWCSVAAENWLAVFPLFVVYALLLGVAVVVSIIIVEAAPCFVVGLPLLVPPVLVGPMAVCLAQLQGKRWTFGTFFKGFACYGSVLGYFFYSWLAVVGATWAVLMAVVVVPGIMYESRLPGWNLHGTAGEPLAYALTAGVAAAVFTRVGSFGPQLLLDRGCSSTAAVGGSWRLSRGRFWALFGFQMMLLVLNFVGFIMFGIGLLFTLPLTQLAAAAAYLHAVGELSERRDRGRNPTRHGGPGVGWK